MQYKKWTAVCVAVVMALGLLAGCGGGGSSAAAPSSQAQSAPQGSQPQSQAGPLASFTDALGRQVVIEQQPQKVAAVSGSYAEVWLLAGGTLAAVTEDAYDERQLELDDTVVTLGALKSPSVEMMIEEGIDFVLLSSTIEEHVNLCQQLEDVGIACAYFEVEVFEDYLAMLDICTDITGNKEMYAVNGTDIRTRVDAAIATQQGHDAPTVLFIRAFSSGANAKNSTNSMGGIMLKEMGCINIADSEDSLLEDLSMEVIIQQDPDYIFVVTMGASEEKALDTVQEMLVSNPAWSGLTAVQNDRYVVLPKALFHQKPNSRWAESYELLANILYGG